MTYRNGLADVKRGGEAANASCLQEFSRFTLAGSPGNQCVQSNLIGTLALILPAKRERLSTLNLKSINMADVNLTAYNVKTKEKNVPIQDAVVTKTAKGAYMVQGHDGKGNKLTTLCNEEKALAAINAGLAKKGW